MVNTQESTSRTSFAGQATREFSWWNNFWSWLVGIFLLFATITNFLHGIFHFDLLPLFSNTLADFRHFTHWVLDTFLFSWITWLLAHAWLSLTMLLSYVFADIKPLLPAITVPSWYKDLALISAILSRANSRGLAYLNSLKMEFKYDDYDGNNKLLRSNFILFVICAICTKWENILNPPIRIAYYAAKRIIYILFRSSVLAKFIASTIGTAFDGISMNGLGRFISTSIVFYRLRSARGNDAILIQRFARRSWLSLALAILSSVVFFAVNGYLLDVQP